MSVEKTEVLVITRTKDRPLLLARAIDSVANQSLSGWLHIVVNDGGDRISVDEVHEKMPTGLGRRRVIHNKTSMGMEAASIVAVEAAESEFIALLDDDDSWSPDFLSKMISHLKKTGAQGVACHTMLVHEELVNGVPREVCREIFNPSLKAVSLFATCRRPQFTTNGFVFRRDAYQSVGGFNSMLPVVGDWDFNVRFLTKYDIDFIHEVLAFYHIRQSVTDCPNSNYTVSGAKPHEVWMAKVLNAKLREDLNSGIFGLGTIMNIAQDLDRLEVASKNPIFYVIQELKAKVSKRLDRLKRYLFKN